MQNDDDVRDRLIEMLARFKTELDVSSVRIVVGMEMRAQCVRIISETAELADVRVYPSPDDISPVTIRDNNQPSGHDWIEPSSRSGVRAAKRAKTKRKGKQ